MPDISRIKENMDVISSDKKMVGQVDHLEGSDMTKLTKSSSPRGERHHLVPTSWIDYIDQHVNLSKTGTEVTAQWTK